MAVKKDCFAWNGTECKCLIETYCEEEYQARRNETEEKLQRSGYYVRKMAKNAGRIEKAE